MKARPPLGVIRLLIPIAGRAARRRRGALAPIVWRRRVRPVRAASILRFAPPPPPAATNLYLALNLAWPVAAAVPAPASAGKIEQTFRQIFRVGQSATAAGANRLLLLVERLWRDRIAAGESGGIPPASARAIPRCEATMRLPLPRRRSLVAPAAGRVTRRTPMVDQAAMQERLPDLRPPPGLIHRRRKPMAKAHSAPSAQRSLAAPDATMAAPGRRSSRALIWRWPREAKSSPMSGAGVSSGPSRNDPALIWRNPAAAGPAQGTTTPSLGSAPATWQAVAQPAQPAPVMQTAAPVAQAPDIGRLVDEVVRRLERIDRDERMRRGL